MMVQFKAVLAGPEAYRATFAFFGLSAGDYDVIIEADGCETCSTKIKTQPGEFIPSAPLRLILK